MGVWYDGRTPVRKHSTLHFLVDGVMFSIEYCGVGDQG